MKTALLLVAISAAFFFGIPASADTMQDQLNGTWSGTCTIAGIPDAMTIEIKHDDAGKLTGRFVTPKSIVFTKSMFDAKAHSLLLEGTDATSGKFYKISAKVQGTEIKGTATVGEATGPVDLIKWTYVPRINGY